MAREAYLGDGVYYTCDENMITLDTRGQQPCMRVFLEPEVLLALCCQPEVILFLSLQPQFKDKLTKAQPDAERLVRDAVQG